MSRAGSHLWRIVAVVVIALSLALVQGAVAMQGPATPKPPRGPGALGLPSPPSPAVSGVVREAALDMYSRRFGLKRAEGARRLDVQARAQDLSARLVERLGRGLSHVYFDNGEGRYVVVVSRRGSEREAGRLLGELGLAGSEAVVRRGDLDYIQRDERADAVSGRLLKVITAGHAAVALVPAGVEITVAAGASRSERALVEAAAGRPGVFVKRSGRDDLSATAQHCDGNPDRYCNALRAGSRYHSASGADCTLAWRAGSYDGVHPNQYLTAGHCVVGGYWWWTCKAGGTPCPSAGYELNKRDDYGGDSGLLYVYSRGMWAQQSGHTDWRDGSRQPITRYEGWYVPVATGTVVCHGGATTMYHCGTIYSGRMDSPTRSSMVATIGMCTNPGDSGGPVFTADMRGAVGIHSGAEWFCGLTYSEPVRRAIENMGVWPYGG